MSWLFSQALVAESSVDISLDGAPCALSSGTPTPQASWLPAKTTGVCRLSRSGMTFKPLTADHGAELLTWFREVFLVSTFPALDAGQESTPSDPASGEKWPESLAKYDPDSRSWRTAQCSLFGGLEEFSETWPRWGTMRSGACWALPTPARHTNETESGFWPTPNCPNGGRSVAHVKDWRGQTAYHNGKKVQVNLESKVRLWPTPTVQDSSNNGAPSQMERNSLPLNAAVKLATPQARDYRTGENRRWENPERTRNLNDQIGGQLNPAWVEWLMGWPVSWTDLESHPAAFPAWQQAFTNESTVCAASETDRCPQPLRSHGKP
jgi:hypothetical protein